MGIFLSTFTQFIQKKLKKILLLLQIYKFSILKANSISVSLKVSRGKHMYYSKYKIVYQQLKSTLALHLSLQLDE